MRDKPRCACVIKAAVMALGDQWSLIALRDVMSGGRRHFPELLSHSEEGIASNILSSRLKASSSAVSSRRSRPHEGGERPSLTQAGAPTVPIRSRSAPGDAAPPGSPPSCSAAREWRALRDGALMRAGSGSTTAGIPSAIRRTVTRCPIADWPSHRPPWTWPTPVSSVRCAPPRGVRTAAGPIPVPPRPVPAGRSTRDGSPL